MQIFKQNGVQVITGCSEIEIEKIVQQYLENNLVTGENACGGEYHHCHNHNKHHNCEEHSGKNHQHQHNHKHCRNKK